MCIIDEKNRLAHRLGSENTLNRHHFLALREPEHTTLLADAGITDDFTMGYADVAGFRLGTCRPVRWFDPVAMRLTNLTLHPMTVMECTLDRPNYMYLNYEQARSTCFALLAEVRKHHGEAVLLWHNTQLAETFAVGVNYQRQLYLDLLGHLYENK